MGQIILIWGFPFYLIVLELLFRGVSGHDTSAFVGPAIAAAGLSFLLPLTQPKTKTLSDSLHGRAQELIEANGGVVVNVGDLRLLPFVWIAILIGFLVWFWSSQISLTATSETFLLIPSHIAVGGINYLMAAILSAIKGRV